MRIILPWFICLTLSLASGPLCAQKPPLGVSREDGNHLLEECHALLSIADSTSPSSATETEWHKFFWCEGYLEATRDRFLSVKMTLAVLAMAGLKFSGPEKAPEGAIRMLDPVCIPDEVPLSQMARVVVKWLEEHPERLHELQSTLVKEAFADAFPCRAETRKPEK